MSILALVVVLGAAAVEDSPSERTAEQARALLRAEGCQAELPDVEAASAPFRLPKLRVGGAGASPAGRVVAEGVWWTFIVVLAVTALVGAFLIALHLLRIGAARAPDVPPPPQAPVESAAAQDAAAPAWDVLARAGRLDEALRGMLGTTFAALVTRGLANIRPASTSREVLALSPLPAPVVPPLASLVAAVESSLFAGVPVGRADFDAAITAYERVRHALGEP